MLRSMYSGISGMKGFQTKLDVIGNNIANVNTYGFKKGRVIFKDLVSQQLQGASAPGVGRGGTNPRQVGLGSQLAAIDTLHTEGSTQTTGRTLDLAISGDGYFTLQDGTGATANTYFTRAGNFYLDKDRNLVNADGLKVLDSAGNPIKLDATKEPKNISIGSNGDVSVTYQGSTTPESAGIIRITRFNNNDGLQKVGNNLFLNTNNSGNPINATANTQGAGSIVSSTLEMSNVDLSEEFTEMIVAQRGFQANTRIITTSDEILQELVNLKR